MRLTFKSLAWLLPGAAMCLTACQSQEPGDNLNFGNDGEGIGYLSFTIQSQTRSDADEINKMPGDETVGDEVFNNGDANEYAICPNFESNAAIFFDKDGNFYGLNSLQPYSEALTGDTQHNTNPHPGTSADEKYPETYYTYVTRWRNAKADKPAQVIVILNCNPDNLKKLAQELTDATESGSNALEVAKAKGYDLYDTTGKYTDYGVYNYGGENYFTMTNSSYMNGNEEKTVTSIADVQVCATAEQALANPVTVFVERVLAKFQLTFTQNDGSIKTLTSNADNLFISPVPAEGASANSVKVNYVASYTGEGNNLDYPSYETIDWKAYIVNWGISGLEKKATLLKNIEEGSVNYFTNWNSTPLHRSYWGVSPSYALNNENGGVFTTQYRNEKYDPAYNELSSLYRGNTNYDIDDETQQLNTLYYKSFNQYNNRAQYKYTAERTYNELEGREGYGPYRYGSHYLIAAQLVFPSVDGEDNALLKGKSYANQQISTVKDKYYAYNFYWGSAEDYIRYSYRRMATQVTDGRNHDMLINGVASSIQGGVSDGYLYVAETPEGDEKPVITRLEVKDAAKYFELVSAQTVHGDGKQVLSLKEGYELYYKTREATLVLPAEYTKLWDDQITGMIYTFSEPAKHFAKGAMYYAVPVQHNRGLYSSDNTVKVTKDMPEQPIGQFGTVRNHWYRLNVSAINNIGIPVDNPDQPIIPDPEDEYYIAVEIVVLPWNVINNGSVGL